MEAFRLYTPLYSSDMKKLLVVGLEAVPDRHSPPHGEVSAATLRQAAASTGVPSDDPEVK